MNLRANYLRIPNRFRNLFVVRDEVLQINIERWNTIRKKIRVYAPGDPRGCLTDVKKALYYAFFGYADFSPSGEKAVLRYKVSSPHFKEWVRKNVILRDNGVCNWCKKKPTNPLLDRLVPRYFQGPSVPENLVVCCEECKVTLRNPRKRAQIQPIIMPRGVLDLHEFMEAA